jgi:hypothetical protein
MARHGVPGALSTQNVLKPIMSPRLTAVMLAVYDAKYGVLSAPLWKFSMKDGLSVPQLELFRKFRKDVQAAEKHP